MRITILLGRCILSASEKAFFVFLVCTQLEIAQELDKLSAKLDCIEQTIAPSLLDPQVQRLLSATADLWIPTITASSDERISIASASNSEIPNKDNIVVAKESEE
jgi:hypothetical protein